MAQQLGSGSITGLSSFAYTIVQAGPYFFEGKISLPTITNGGGASACVVTGVQNSTTVYTGTAGAEGFRFDVLGAVGDVITITLSSAAAPDQPLNVIKATIEFGLGV